MKRLDNCQNLYYKQRATAVQNKIPGVQKA